MKGFLFGCVLALLAYGAYKSPVFGLIVLAILVGCTAAWYEIVRPLVDVTETNEQRVLQPVRDRSKKLRRLEQLRAKEKKE